MRKRHLHPVILALVASVLWLAATADQSLPEFKAGDRATEDIFSPGIVRVMDPIVSERLKQESAAQVPMVFRQVITAGDEAERELRTKIDDARLSFLAAFRQASGGRKPDARDVDSAPFQHAIRETASADLQGLPINRLAPLWIAGVSDAPVVDALVLPVRELMAQAIASENESDALPVDQLIRLIPVKDRLSAPGLAELETAGVATTAADLSSVEMARNVAESYFPPGQESEARFAAGFIRENTFAAPGLTELLRSRKRDDAIAYDTYTTGQLMVKKGQIIDGKALALLAAVREKRMIDALLTKVETKTAATKPLITDDTKKLAAWVGAAGVILLLILWRWGGALARGTSAATPVESSTLWATDDSGQWRTRALLAEQRADEAHEAIRQGALGWMKERLFRSVFRQRADLLSNQQMAEAEMIELERRMEKLLVPLQERIRTYENRIKELEETLAAQDGTESQMIDARISRARQQLEVERSRLAENY